MKLKLTRRQLVKGGLAAPLVMTVRSASATGWAQHSAKGMCKVKDKDKYDDKPPRKFTKYKDDDRWVRCEVQICKLEKKKSHGSGYHDLDGEYFKGNTGCYWQVEGSGDNCRVTKKDDYNDHNCRVRKVVRKDWALVSCDDDGHVKGFCWEHPHHSPLTYSCWNSMTKWKV